MRRKCLKCDKIFYSQYNTDIYSDICPKCNRKQRENDKE